MFQLLNMGVKLVCFSYSGHIQIESEGYLEWESEKDLQCLRRQDADINGFKAFQQAPICDKYMQCLILRKKSGPVKTRVRKSSFPKAPAYHIEPAIRHLRYLQWITAMA